jgi:hypothetical protein
MQSCKNSIHVRDITFSTGQAGGGNAVGVTQSGTNCSATNYAQSDFFRTTFRGDDGGNATDYWNTGVSLQSVWGVNFDTAMFWGSSSRNGNGIAIVGTGSTTYAALMNVDKSLFLYTNIGIVYGSYD